MNIHQKPIPQRVNVQLCISSFVLEYKAQEQKSSPCLIVFLISWIIVCLGSRSICQIHYNSVDETKLKSGSFQPPTFGYYFVKTISN